MQQEFYIMYRLVTVVLIVGAVAAAVFYRPTTPIDVVTARVERGVVESTVANTRAGTVKAARRAKVAPTISGKVVDLRVVEGDRVEAGTLLLELWSDDLKASLKLAESRITVAEARHEEACRNTEFYEREADRLSRLAESGDASPGELDRATTRAAAGRALCDANLGEISGATAQVEQIRAKLDQTLLRAPFAGIVAEVNCELGEVVTPSPPGIPTPPAIELVDTGQPYVSAPIDEVDAPRIEVGMPARISLDAVAGRSFAGTVRRVAPYVLDAEKQARTVEIEVSFDHPEGLPWILPGYSADAEVLISRQEGVLRLPTEALMDGDRVLVLPADGGPLESRLVTIGLRNWMLCEVVSGLNEGDDVVITWQRDGVEVGVTVRAERRKNPERSQ